MTPAKVTDHGTSPKDGGWQEPAGTPWVGLCPTATMSGYCEDHVGVGIRVGRGGTIIRMPTHLPPPGQLWLWTLLVASPPHPRSHPLLVSPAQELARPLTPEPQADGAPDPRGAPPPCQPQTDRQAGRHARQAICLVVFFERGRDFQGEAHRVCGSPPAAHPVADMQAGGGCSDSHTRGGGVPSLCLSGAGEGFHPPPMVT